MGRNIDFGEARAQVIGILSPLPLLFAPDRQILRDPDIWIAGRIDYRNSARNQVFLTPVGLLRQRVTFQTAEGQVESVAAELRRRLLSVARQVDISVSSRCIKIPSGKCGPYSSHNGRCHISVFDCMR